MLLEELAGASISKHAPTHPARDNSRHHDPLPSAAKRELAFVDRNVDDLETLLAGIRPNVEAILLSNDEPASRQMARTLARKERVDAVHIIAHGRTAVVAFGAGALSFDTLEENASDLAELGRTLRGAVLHLWSCETASGQHGAAFIEALARATCAKVAAAVGRVGAAKRGGTWVLDYSNTATVMAAPLTAWGQSVYAATLDDINGANTMTSNQSNTTVTDGNGTNTLTVTGSSDKVSDGNGTNTVTVTGSNDTVSDGNGTNTVTVTGSNNTVSDGNGTNTVTVTGNNEKVTDGNGTNTVIVTGSSETVTDGNGSNLIYMAGTTGNNTINDGNGTNIIVGGAGNDAITDGNGNNIIYGGAGNDTIKDGNGSNVVIGGSGSDNITTANGSDLAIYALSDHYTVSGSTLHSIAGDVDYYSSGNGTDTLRIVLTSAEYNLVHGQLAAYSAWMAANKGSSQTYFFNFDGGTSGAGGAISLGAGGGLVVGGWENLQLQVVNSGQITVGSASSASGSVNSLGLFSNTVGTSSTAFTDSFKIVGLGAGTTGPVATSLDPTLNVAQYLAGTATLPSSYTVVGQDGTLTLHSDGTYNYTVTSHTVSTDVFTITTLDQNGFVTSTTLNFSVAAVNHAPSQPTDSNSATNSISEGASNGALVGITAASTDVDGNTVTYSLTNDAGGRFAINANTGVVTVANGSLLDYESAPGHSYSITVQASDGTLTSSQSFAIAVTDVAPLTPTDSNGATNTVAENAANGTTVGITAASSDIHGGTVTYSITADTSGGAFAVNSSTGIVTVADTTKLDYESAPGHSYSITVQASDGTLTSSQSFAIAVTDVAPLTPTDSNGATNTVAENAANGTTVGITAASSDVHGGTVTFSLTDDAGGRFAIDSSTGVVSVANASLLDYETATSHTITVQAADPSGAFTTQTFTINVTDVAPSQPTDSNNAANSISEGASNGDLVGITAASSDVHGGTVTFSLTDDAGGRFAIDSSTGVVSVANASLLDYETATSHTITVQAADPSGAFTTQTFTINVTDVAPSQPTDSNNAANSISEGASNGDLVGITAASSDVHGGTVTFSLTDDAGGRFAIDSSTGVVSVANASLLDYETATSHTITVQAADPSGAFTTQTFTINVTDVAPSQPTDSNNAANSISEGASNGDLVGITAASSDVHGGTVTFSLTDDAGGRFAIDSSTGVVSVANASLLDYETATSHTITVQAADPSGAFTTQTFTINVTDVAPSQPTDSNNAANSISEGASNGDLVGITAASSDVHGGTVTFSLTDDAGGRFAIDSSTGVVSVANASLLDYETATSHTITVQAADPSGAFTTQTFTINVTDVAPSQPTDSNNAANSISEGASNGDLVGITAASSDVHGGTVTFSLTDDAGGRFAIDSSTGVVSVANASLLDYETATSHTITVQAADPSGAFTTQTFTINVTDVAPSQPTDSNNAANSISEGASNGDLVGITAASSDVHGGTVTFSLTDDAGGRFAIDSSTGVVSVANASLLDYETATSHTITVQAADPSGAFTTQTFTINVTDVAPSQPTDSNNAANSISEGASNGDLVGITAASSDVHGGTVTFSLTDDAGGRFAIDSSTGVVSVANASLLDYETATSHTITVQAADPSGAFTTQTFTINVTDVAPSQPTDSNNAANSISEGASNGDLVGITAASSDVHGGTVTFSLTDDAGGRFAIDSSTGVVSVANASLLDYETATSHTITVQAADPSGAFTTQTFTINVTDVAPSQPTDSNNAANSISEGASNGDLVGITAASSDVHGGTVTFSLTDDAGGRFAIDSSTGVVSVANASLLDYETATSHTITVQAADPSGAFTTQTFTINVTDVAPSQPTDSNNAANSISEGASNGDLVGITAASSDVHGGTVTFSLTDDAGGRFAIDSSTGVVSVANASLLDYETATSHTITVQAADPSGAFTTQTFTINVTDVAPSQPTDSNNAANSISEGASNGDLVGITAASSDVHGGTVTFSLTDDAGGRFAIDSSTGVVSVANASLLDYETATSHTITVQAADPSGAFTTQTFTINVTDVAPSQPTDSNNAANSISEGASNGDLVGITAASSDVHGGTVTFSLTDDAGGRFAIDSSTGVVSVANASLLDYETATSHTITVQAADPSGAFTTQTFTINVTDVAPSQPTDSNNAANSISEGASNGDLVGITAASSDVHGGTVTFSLTDDAGGRFAIDSSTGVVSVANASLLDYETATSHTITVQAADPSGAFTTQTFTINVTDVAPSQPTDSNNAANSISEGASNGDLVGITAASSDVHGGTVTFSLTDDAGGRFAIDSSTGVVSVANASLLDYETATSHTITVQAADPSGAFTTQTFTINVTDVAPSQPTDSNNAANSISEGASNGDLVGITAASSDVHGGTVTFSLTDDAGGRFAIDSSTGVVSVANASLLDYETATSHTITVQAADPSGAFTTQTFTINVTDVAPSQPTDSNNAANSISEGASNGDLVGITAASSDVHGGTVTFSLTDDAGGRFAIDSSTGVVSVANASLLDYETATSHTITVQAADPSGAFTTQTFTINVTDVAPSQPTDSNNAANSISEGASNGDLVGITAASSDVHGGTVTFSLTDDAGGRFAIDSSTGVVSVANASLLDYETATSHTITVQAADPSGAFTTQTFTINVTDVAPSQPTDSNNAANSISEGASNGDLVGITAASSDVHGGTVTFSLTDDAGGRFAIDSSTGVVSVANASLLDYETATSHTITVQAADPSGAFTTQTFTINVTDVAPSQPTDSNNAANSISEGASNGDLVGITAASSDVHGGTVTFSLTDDAGGRFAIDSSTGVVSVANASLLDYETATSHTITVQAADPSGAFTTQTFTINVTDVAPSQPTDSNNAANSISEGASNGDLVGITAASSDVHGGTVTFSLTDDAGGRFAIDSSTGVVSVANASLLDYETATSHTITVQAADPSGAFTTQTFTINVTDVAPSQPTDSNNAANSISEGASNGDLVGITAASSDVHGGTVTFSLTDDAGGRFAIDSSTGVVSVANASLLDYETATSHTITVQAADPSGAFTTQTFTINVTDVAPSQPTDSNNAANSISEGASNGDLVGITAASSDVHGGTVTFSLTDDAGGRFAIDSSTGVVSVANASLLDYETATSHTITVQAADPSGAFTTQTFTINVTDVAPSQPTDSNNAANSISEGASNGDLVGITAASSDVHGGTVTFSLTDDAGGRFAIDSSTGVVSVANASLLDYETATSHTITVQAADPSGAFTTQTFTINVTDVAPSQPTDSNNAANSISEGASNGDLVGITAASSDVHGGTVTFSLTDDAGGRFAIDSSTGVVSVANASLLDYETATSHTITVQAADPSGAFTTQTFTINVTDVAPSQPTDSNNAANSISEGASNGDLVGITAASSDVHGGTVTFSLTDDAGGRFAIDSSTGVVSVANASLLDYETATSHTITVQAADPSGAFTTQTFTINVTDVAPSQPTDSNNAANSISEGASNGDLVGITAASSDVHGGTVTFSLTDDAGGRFAIDSSTGVVSVANASLLDYETATSHTITVQAADPSGAFTTQTFTINVTDVAPSQPTDSNNAANSISEGASNGDLVGITAASSDVHGGTVTFSLTDDAGGRFAIDSSTGVVSVANASLLDYETATSHTITVQAADPSGAFTTQTFTINVTDVAPSQPTDSNNAANSISEGASNGDLVGITAASSDVHGGTVTFSLTDDAGGRFAIDSSTGVVSVANASLLDYETATSHTITVQAADPSGAFTTQTFTINVTDVAPSQPTDSNNAANSISEGASNGDLVGITAASSDVHGGTVTFSLTDDAGGRFAIDSSTGVVSVANASLLDYETATSHTITVQAADPSGAFTTQTFTINVTDVAPSQPTDSNNAANSISEGASNGDLVGITAASSDVHGGTVTFSLTDDAGGRFAIDSSTGVVSVANASLLDYETATSHTITVQAADPSGAFTTQTFTINVTDVAPSQPTDSNNAANSISEGASNGDLVGITAASSDVHGGTVTFSLTDDAGGRFAIDSSTGVVSVANASLLDYETATSHTITVQAADPSGAFTTQTFTINVTDVAPSQPTDSNNAANSISEGASNGDLVGITAASSDVHGGTVTFSLTDDAGGRFAIDSSTGVVSVANASLLDYETATSHTITVQAADPSGAFTTQTFTINVTDVAPSQPTDSNNAANSISEGASNGDLVGITAASSDVHGGTVTFSLTDDAGGRFAIDSSTGVVSVANASLLDYETATSHTITVQAADPSGAFTTQTFTINVTDVAPSQPTDSNNAANSISEGASNGDLVGITAASSDVHGGTVTFSLTDDAGGRFAINSSTGVVSVANASLLDYETATSHTITVQAADPSGAFTTQTFTINVTDVAPSQPTDSNNAANSISEGASNGDLVGITAASSDVHGGTVTFSLTDDAGGRFAIDSSTGVVSVANASLLDYETATSHTITVQAADPSGAFTTQTFTINVTDVAPSQPTDSNNAANSISEGASNGDLVGITAASSDVHGGTVTFSLTDDAGGRFAIDSSTGVVSVANASLLDYETAPGHSYSITVQASDGTLTSSQSFAIAVTDVAPLTPTDSNGATNTVAENAANGTTVGITAASSDIHGGTVTYSITADTSGGAFAVNSSTGIVTVADTTKLDYESAPGHSYSITVQASDGTLTSSQSFAIAVTDVAPLTPTDSNGATNTVAENAANGTTVGITAASSDVHGGTVTYSITADTSGGAFAVNSSTGIVTVADTTKLDYESAPGHSYSITVQASDGTLTSSQSFAIAVTDVAPVGVNDTSASAGATAATEKGGTANGSGGVNGSGNVLSNDTDVHGGALTVTAIRLGAVEGSGTAGTVGSGLVGARGTLTLNTNGSYTYVVNENDTTVQALNVGGTTTDNFNYTVSDGNLTDTATLTVTINGANDAPVNSIPGNQSFAKNTSLVFNAANSNLISISDPDNTSHTVTLTGTFTGGSFGITLSTIAGLTFTVGDGSDDTTMTFSGTDSAINAALSGMHYDPQNGKIGTGSIQIVTSDGSLSDSDTINITVHNPAGITGSAINLGLTDPITNQNGQVTVTINDVPTNWVVNGATQQLDGSWAIQSDNLQGLTVTTPVDFVGAAVLAVSETWTNPDGSIGTLSLSDNIEAYAVGSPIFAVAGDDNLTGSSGNDQFVFSQPIGNDVVYSFDSAYDQIDLIGYAGFTTFADVQANLADDANGNAVLTLGSGQSITLNGVASVSLSASNFEFDQNPVTSNPGTMLIGDGALLPLSGTVDNTGTIALNSAGSASELELIQHGITLQGGGQVVMSDFSGNVITGTTPDVTLTNIDNTISGAGQIGESSLTLVNQGTIIADGANVLLIDTGANVITNAGTLEATGSGGLDIAGDLTNSGNLWADGGNITVHGAVTGNGSALIDHGASIEFGGAASANTIFAANDSGALQLDNSAGFTGTVTGFAANDQIDLGDIQASSAVLSFADNGSGTGGTLTVSDGTHTATITLVGVYDPTGFHLDPDHALGTVITYSDHAMG